jgi:hypothetical protein
MGYRDQEVVEKERKQLGVKALWSGRGGLG